jgi:hypothetical protein
MKDEREDGDDYEPGSFGDLDSGGRIRQGLLSWAKLKGWFVLAICGASVLFLMKTYQPPPPSEGLVPYEVTLDQSMGAIKPGARIIHLRVYHSAITKGQCTALLDVYRERAGTGQVRVDPPDTSSRSFNGEEYTPMNHWALCVRNGEGDGHVIYPQRLLDKTGYTGGRSSDRAGTDSED